MPLAAALAAAWVGSGFFGVERLTRIRLATTTLSRVHSLTTFLPMHTS